MTARAYLILVLFLIWSSFSWWWYTCKIKGLCNSNNYQSAIITENISETEELTNTKILKEEEGSNSKENNFDHTSIDLDNQKASTSADDEQQINDKGASDIETNEELTNEENSETDEKSVIDNSDTAESSNDLASIEKSDNNSSKSSDASGIVRMDDKTLIYFEYLSDNPQLNTQTQNFLNQIANDLNNDKYKSISVTGYTDNIGNTKNNYYKGLDRARAIQSYLIENGAKKYQIELKSYGEYRPVADNATEDGRAQNRRVEVNLNY